MKFSNITYNAYKVFVRFLHNRMFYNRFYVKGQENIPNDDIPTIIACNHQNCANDPLAIILSLPQREHPYVFARGDVFSKSRIADKFFNWIGMLPIFRLGFDGEQSLQKNDKSFKDASDKLFNRNKLIIFPEATHMSGHFLGIFSLGYLHFAFTAAKSTNFEKDIQILPCCNHYSSYHGRGHDLIIQYGKPISLKPFYELYKVRPRTAQRAVNILVRSAIKNMMVDIDDISNYQSVDFIRNSEVGDIFAQILDKNYMYFPDKKESDKKLISILNYYKEQHPETIDTIYNSATQIEKMEKNIHISEKQMKRNPNWAVFALKMICSILCLPLFLYSLIQCGLLYLLPHSLVRKDKMFFNSLFFIISFVIVGPLFLIITSILLKNFLGWLLAIIWMVSFPFSLILLSHYIEYWEDLIKDWRYLTHPHKIKQLKSIRHEWMCDTVNILKSNIA